MEERIESTVQQESLAKVNSGVIAQTGHPLSVGDLERALLKRYPEENAESWDRMGLIVGDPAALISRVLIALDPTLSVIDAAVKANANVVLTHHPVFLAPPTEFHPSNQSSDLAGALVAQALSKGVALLNVHTAIDCTSEVQHMLPSLLNLEADAPLVPLDDKPGLGYGALCTLSAGETMRLDHLAARCLSIFGQAPRVWGSPNEIVSNIAVVNGAAGAFVDACVKKHADCLICGELHYHQILDARQRGLAVIELGHDVSELPLTALLAQVVVQIGLAPEHVLMYEQAPQWFVPDAVRA